METKEKILLLGSLFHDIGKFQQRVENITENHSSLGAKFIDELSTEFEKIVGIEGVSGIKKIISSHHSRDVKDELVGIVQSADHLSASQRVKLNNEDSSGKWSHKYLCSLFSKIYLNQDDEGERVKRYYAQKKLNKKDYHILIPEYDSEEDIKKDKPVYSDFTFEEFKRDVKSVLGLYETEDDFNTIIDLLLIVFENYMWCIPDFTGSENTDISLYNHLKDIAGLAHAISKSDNKKLNLIIGDIPGIQKYIFNITEKQPAKILRGRSVFVQILTRQFASIILESLGLTNANLVMNAGGKFYIIAQSNEEFEELLSEAGERITDILIKNYNYQLRFSYATEEFNYEELKNNEITFGEIIDNASFNLLQKRNKQFENVLFEKGDFDQEDFILRDKYIEPIEEGNSNSITCEVTGLPIREGRLKFIEKKDEDKTKIKVDAQVYNEYRVGSEIPRNNLVLEFDEGLNEILEISSLERYKSNGSTKRFIINPTLNELLNKGKEAKSILKNMQMIEVANYCTMKENKSVLSFDDIEDASLGAKYVTLIKGDVDNLGLIMSNGLYSDKENLNSISRISTLSNHLKYYFSFFLNGFLKDWEKGKILSEETAEDKKVYTVYAGGDDLLLVAPQSSALKLVKEFDEKFREFVCGNKEIHISYSLTNFKRNTPIRMVADIAEENQETIKKDFKNSKAMDLLGADKKVFYPENDKAGVRLHGTSLKLDDLDEYLALKNKIISWLEDEKNKFSFGVLRNMFEFAKIIKEFQKSSNPKYLMWRPKLTYMIKRLLLDKDGKYPNEEMEKFFESIMKIHKSSEEENLENMLYPLVCDVIYATRNTKGE